MVRDIKVFVDADEEVTFIVEKVENAPSPRVCIVVPDGAALLRSLVGLKLLRKNLISSKKIGVVVTMDDEAKRLCEIIGLKCVERVGEVSEEVWVEGEKLLSAEAGSIKKPAVIKNDSESLIGRVAEAEGREEDESPKESDAEVEPENKPKGRTNDLGIEFRKGAELEPLEKAGEQEEEAGDKRVEKLKSSVKTFFSGAIAKAGVFASGVSARVKSTKEKKAKVTNSAESVGQESEFVVPAEHPRSSVDLMRYKGGTRRRVVKASWSPATLRRPAGGSGMARRGRRPRLAIPSIFQKIKIPFAMPKGKIPYYIAAGLAVTIFLLFIYLYFIAPSAKIVIYVEAQTISENIAVSGSAETLAADSESLSVPVTLHATTEEGATSGMATGSGVVGDKATGNVSVINNTMSAITVSDGASITCISSSCNGLVFKAISEITIQPVNVDTVPVVAADVGANYNVSSGQSFKLGSHDPVSAVVIKNLTAFSGGTSQNVTVVTKKDMSDLEDSLKGSLFEACSTKLRNELGESTAVIEKSLKSEVSSKMFDKNEKEQADVINLSMSVSCSALIYRRSDISQVVEDVATAQVQDGYSLDKGESFEFEEVVESVTGTTAQFQVTISAKASPIVDASELKSEIKGKSLRNAVKKLDELSNITEYSLTYSPNWAPGFLKRIPSNENLINLEIQLVSR